MIILSVPFVDCLPLVVVQPPGLLIVILFWSMKIRIRYYHLPNRPLWSTLPVMFNHMTK
ncbi:hypothetical protein LX87_04121 [Larkinella arboricola]|uniref:Uncharacterized protein n=1 Tax=Larkinella arboricola TaxID=643671 RepID=A0A327WQL6_LARAB|nr:hypothetical protein LX87_04121 [Larkinella arboricola]